MSLRMDRSDSYLDVTTLRGCCDVLLWARRGMEVLQNLSRSSATLARTCSKRFDGLIIG